MGFAYHFVLYQGEGWRETLSSGANTVHCGGSEGVGVFPHSGGSLESLASLSLESSHSVCQQSIPPLRPSGPIEVKRCLAAKNYPTIASQQK